MKNIIITGGGMGNKGAQSMTFIAVDELRKRYPQDRIVMLTPMEYDASLYRFDMARVSLRAMKQLLQPVNPLAALAKRVRIWETAQLRKLLQNARLVLDISGYALGSNWADGIVDYYLTAFECARKYSVPVYVMPQSFGPFAYEGERAEQWMSRIRETMAYPKLVFAREQEGYALLKDGLGLSNVELSCDMVLLNKGVEPEAIYRQPGGSGCRQISSGAVAVLPNTRNFDHGNREAIMAFYRTAITWLRSRGREVYVMHHSGEDAPICKKIKEMFSGDGGVVLMEEELDCFGYEKAVQSFDYIIASRYHSIIHALRNGVPCIALGWAVKYQELLGLFGQEQYMFDVRRELEEALILSKLEKLDREHNAEREQILSRLEQIRKMNLFDRIAEMEA